MEDTKVFLGRLTHANIENEIISQTYCNDINSTTDHLELENEILYKCVGKEILTGNEEWYYSKEKDTYYYNQFNKAIDSKNCLKMMSNYFHFSNNEKLKWGEFQSGNNEEIHFKFDESKNNICHFKNWLKSKYMEGTPVEVYFVLQYPVILCRRFSYDANPRFVKFKGKNYSLVSNDEKVSAIFFSSNRLYYETDNIYMRKIK